MAEIKWTEGQKNAIDHNNGSMIVTAAAGSGKTAVIVARVLRLVKTCDIDRLIIVTFTNAAAQQMRDKLSEGLLNAIKDEKTTDADRKNYQKQLLLLPGANICTVHSFCMRLIKENFDKLDISPNFNICDNAQRSMLFDAAADELLEECYEDESFKAFAQKFVTSKRDIVEEYTKEIYKASRKVPFPKKWLAFVLESYRDYKNAEWYKFFVKDIAKSAYDAVKEYREYVLNYISGIEDLQFVNEMVEKDTAQFSNLTQDTEYAQLYETLSKVSFDTLDRRVNKIDTQKNISAKRDEFKGLIKSLIPELSPKELESFMKIQYENLKIFVSLAEKLDEKYTEKKKKAQLLEFDDLEHLAIKLLCDEDGNPTDFAKELSNEYDEIIIDEYQDTNDIQETIFSAISKENMFMVGDMKQSIYSFRNTAPDLFLDKAKKYGRNDGGTRGILSNNFRSRANILDYVNYVFENIMSETAGEVNYDKDERLYFGNKDFDKSDDTSVDLYILDSVKEVSDITAESLKISEIIEKLIENEYVTDKKTGERRKVTYSDICILSRRAKNPIPEIAQVLTKQGIPVSADTGSSMFLETYEVSLVLSYLNILDNPYQDIPLVTVLRCPVYNVSDDILTEISKAGKGTFYEKLILSRDKKELYRFFKDYEALRKMCAYSKCGEIVSYILNNLGVMDFVSNMPGGEQRRVNLEYLQKYAFDFEGAVKKSIYEFLAYTDNLQKYSGEVISPKYMPENLNAVSIMSMHKSKGLEFPVVILEGLGDPYAMRGETASLLAEKNLGLGFTLMDAENFRKISSPVTLAIKKYLQNKALSEELRILYVAMTRAKEKLILVGTATDEKLEKIINKPYVTPEEVKKAKTYLDFIIMGSLSLDNFDTSRYIREGISLHKEKTDIKFKFIRQSFEEFFEDEQEKEYLAEDTTDGEENPEVNRRLEYKYPEKGKYYSKYSVSDLKKLEGEEINPYFEKLVPLYNEEESGAERGTSIHKVFETIDPKKVTDIESIKAFTGDVDPEEIYSFYQSEIGKLLIESDEVYKEAPFIVGDMKDDSEILVQGVIDCYFKCGDGYIIVDYKSDNITDKNRKERIDMYSIQLEYYKKAVKKIHNTEKVKAYIYFTKTKEIWEC